MADAPSEDQVKAANEAEQARWQDDFDQDSLEIKSKPEEENTEEAAGGEEESKDNDEDTETTEPAEAYSEPAPVVTTEDPGDYIPADYSFEVTLKDGKTHKVSTPEEAEKLADDPDNFETPKQLMEFINKQNKMQRNLDRDFDKWEAQKKTYDEQTATQAEREKTVQDLTAGFEYLIAKGLMPKLAPADAVADWNDPEVAKHPGVKEQIDLINYMIKENEQRQKAGIPLLTSALDAYNSWQLDTSKQQKEQEHKEAGEARRAAGARVAPVSAGNQGTYVPKGIAVGRVIPLRGSANWED